jgi:CheY-like chemotaxis protein
VAEVDGRLLARTVLVELPDADALADALRGRMLSVELAAPAACMAHAPSCVVIREGALASLPRAATERFIQRGGQLVVLEEATPEESGSSVPDYLRRSLAYVSAPATPLTLLLALAEQQRDRADAPPDATRPLAGVRVLGVEDNEINRILLSEMLSAAGATLVCAEDGYIAIDRLKADGSARYDIVLCDVEMPGIDGYETTRRLRLLAPELPVVGLTAHAFDLAAEQGRLAGMADYLTKPYTLQALSSVVRRNMRRS